MDKRVHDDCYGCIGAEHTQANELHLYGRVVAVHCGYVPAECNLGPASIGAIRQCAETEGLVLRITPKTKQELEYEQAIAAQVERGSRG